METTPTTTDVEAALAVRERAHGCSQSLREWPGVGSALAIDGAIGPYEHVAMDLSAAPELLDRLGDAERVAMLAELNAAGASTPAGLCARLRRSAAGPQVGPSSSRTGPWGPEPGPTAENQRSERQMEPAPGAVQ